jgi:hypothetical protein
MSKMSCFTAVVCSCFRFYPYLENRQKEVVSAVKAESVVAKVAAVNPSKKMTEISVMMKGDFRKK